MHRGMLCLLLLASSLTALAQQKDVPIGSILRGKVKLDAEPGCYGCAAPGSWVKQSTFPAGSKIWMRAVLQNRTRHDVLMTTLEFLEEFFYFKALDSQGKELVTAGRRCLLSCACYWGKDGSLHRYDDPGTDPKLPPCLIEITASQPPRLVSVKPGKAIALFLDVTDAYRIPGAGDYRIEVLGPNLWQIREQDFHECLFCTAEQVKGAKNLGTLRAKPIAIRVEP